MVKYEDMVEGKIYTNVFYNYNYKKENGILYYKSLTGWLVSTFSMREIAETFVFEEMPWEPKKGEFSYYPSFEQPAGYILTVWKNSRVDNRVKKAVGVYKTPDEALAKARELGWLE